MAYPGETTGAMKDAGGMGRETLGERLGDAAAAASSTLGDARAAATDTVQQAADYLRETEMESMVADVESMVKRHPGPALFVAGVLGVMVGRTLSR
jgi:ElaB/YqjD/DUF883 family membrane-anchored ribosome-binding protein